MGVMFFYHPIKCSALFCLHAALLAYSALIFNGVQSVDNSQKRVHYHLHLSALHMTEDGRSGGVVLVMRGRISCYGRADFLSDGQVCRSPYTVFSLWHNLSAPRLMPCG